MPADRRASGRLMRVGELSRRTGVGTSTLRAWERRYGFPRALRTAGGHRLYGEHHVVQVKAVQGLIEQGWSPAAAAKRVAALTLPTDPTIVAHRPKPDRVLARRLAGALERYDDTEAQAVMHQALSTLDGAAVLELLGAVSEPLVGSGAARPGDGAARFGSQWLRLQILALGDDTVPVAALPTAVAAGVPGDRDDLELALAAAALRTGGWRVVYLGAEVPAEAVAATVQATGAGAVVVSGSDASKRRKWTQQAGLGAPTVVVAVGAEPSGAEAEAGVLAPPRGGYSRLAATLEAARGDLVDA